MNKKIIPNSERKDFTKIYEENSWKNFASRITKNPFVKEYLLERDGCNCQWCNKELGLNFVIHHISYDHSCTFDKMIILKRPTEKRPNKESKVPDCKLCMEEDKNRFNECMTKLVLVHSPCNWVISKISGKP